ncbi:YrhK family protein [Tepidamorphus sp. 3E244]|uniref:YrhK family protein n=1 Tax=Tepidamorphus sp. 3E244 TaxID=3385498 RepID=UPI0038FCA6AB
MAIFDPDNRRKTPRHEAVYAAYEIAFTAADVTAAVLFVAGSALFFFQQYQTPAIWCFLFGSLFFLTKPMLRLARELHYVALGDVESVARAYQNEP